MDSPLIILPETINLTESTIIMNHSVHYGFNNPLVLNGEVIPMWRSFAHRRPVLTDELRDKFAELKRFPDYWLRARTDLEWEWVDQPVTKLVKSVIDRLDPYIIKLNRVQTLIATPNMELLPHTDKVAGTNYGEGVFGLGFEEESAFHHNNEYMTLKFPLYSEHGHGNPYLEVDGIVKPYDTNGHAFSINEFEVKHGAFPVDYWRGVIVMDAVLNLEELRKYDRNPF